MVLYDSTSDGEKLAVGSRDNFIYMYHVTNEGRLYSRIGRCSVIIAKLKLSCVLKKCSITECYFSVVACPCFSNVMDREVNIMCLLKKGRL